MIDPATKRRQLTRMLIVVAVLLFISGGVLALYQLNRSDPKSMSDEQVIEQAQQAFAEEDYERVVNLLESRTGATTVSAIQGNAELLQLYITARQKIPMYDREHLSRMIAPLTTLIELQPSDLDNGKLLVETLLTMDRDEEALKYAQTIIEQHPTDTDMLRHLADAQARMGQTEDALTTLNQAISIDPLHVPTYAQTLDLIEEFDLPLELFIKHAEQVFKDHREDPRAIMIRAMAYKADGDGVQARELFKQASNLAPADPSMTTLLMIWLDREAMYADATRYIIQHAEHGIQTPAGRIAIYRAFESNDYQAILTRFKDSDPDDANTDLLGMWVSAHQHVGSLDQVPELLEALKQRDNEIAETWVKLIQIDQLDNPTPATTIDTIVAALEADDSPAAQAMALRHPYFMQRLGEAYIEALEPEAAYGAFAIAANNSDSWPSPHLSLTKTLLKLKQPNAAAIQAREAHIRANTLESRQWLVIATATAVDPSDDNAVNRVLVEADKLPAESQEAKRVMPSLVAMLARAERVDEAKQRITKALNHSDAFGAESLEALMRRSMLHGLGLEQAIEEKITSLHGMTPGLALIKASLLANREGIEQGRALIEKAMPDPPTKQWQGALADYLINQRDPQAVDNLVKLANQYPDDINLQLAALAASDPGSQPEAMDTLIARLRSLAGESTINWRMQQARFSLQGSPDEQTLKSITESLTKAQDYSPVHLGLRLLLARCYMMLGDDASALEWTQAAKTISPRSPEAMLLQGMVLHRLKRFQAARLDLIPLASNPQIEPSKRWQACIMLNEQGEFAAVRSAIEQMWSQGRANNQMLIILARIYSSAGEFEKADKVCQSLINIPELETVRFISNYYHQTNRPELAQQAVQAAIAAGIEEADHLVLRAEGQAQRGEVASALKLIEDAAKLHPENVERWRVAAQLALSLAKPNEAVRLVQQGLEHVGSDAGLTSLSKHASLIQQIENDPALIPLAVTILNQDDGHEESVRALQIDHDTDNVQAVANALADLVQANPRMKYLSELACDRLLQAGQTEKAFEFARQAMGRFPNSASSARIASLAAFRLQDWSMLLSSADAWAQRSPRDRGNADLMRAAAMNQLKRYTATINTLKPYIKAHSKLDASNQLMFDYYTTALVKSGQAAEAMATLRPYLSTSQPARAIALKLAGQNLAEAKTAAAWIQEVSGNSSKDVQEQFSIVTSSFIAGQRLSDNALVRQAQQKLAGLMQSPGAAPIDMEYAKGQIAQHLGDHAQAEASYRKVLDAVPDNYLVMNNLALILAERGGKALQEAQTLAKQATALVKNDPNLFDTLAVVQLRMGQLDQALATIDKAINLDGVNPSWQLTKADIFEAMDDNEQAEIIRDRYAPKAKD